MIRAPLIRLNSQDRTFSHGLLSQTAKFAETNAKYLVQKHSDSKTTSPDAPADLREIAHLERDLDTCLKALQAETEAVEAAILTLKGEPVFYPGEHPLVRHCEELVAQITALKMVDSDLSVLTLDAEIEHLAQLQSRLNGALAAGLNKRARAVTAAKQARGNMLGRCTDITTVIRHLPAENPLPTHGDWPKVNLTNPSQKDVQNALAYDRLDAAQKRKKLKGKIADKQLVALKEVN